MKYRPHRGMLDESMAEVRDFATREEFIKFLAQDYRSWGLEIEDSDISVESYGFDERINWNTHIVLLKNKQLSDGKWWFSMPPDYRGAIGFTDGPI